MDVDFDFIDANFRERRGCKARLLREDFCGAAKMCCEWTAPQTNETIGFDIDKEVLKWGRENNIARLNGQPDYRQRVGSRQYSNSGVLCRGGRVESWRGSPLGSTLSVPRVSCGYWKRRTY